MENEIELTLEQRHQIARYEDNFKDILQTAKSDDLTVTCQDVYHITLDDLYHALIMMQKKNSTIGEIGEYWLYPIRELSDSFDLDNALKEQIHDYPELITTDYECFQIVWDALEDMWEIYTYETLLSEIEEFEWIFRRLEQYMPQRNIPIMERYFSDREMESYVSVFNDDEYVKNASEEELALARKFIELLIEKENETALRTKGYACYGGNRLYNCNWIVSRDCMLRLFDLTDDPYYANTLGYIYYYGRCNNGVPEYDKAFKYFEIAAANGIYEGMYKLADMYRHGYGCKKSLRTARSLYNIVYNDSIKYFKNGNDANFADAAIRMGKLAVNDQKYISAYRYYLEGAYAAKIRAEKHDYYGSASTAINAQKSVEEIKEKLPIDFFKEYMDYDAPYFFAVLSSDNNLCELSKTIDDDGHVKLNAERIATLSVPNIESILLVISELSLCKRTTEVSYILDDDAEVFFSNGKDSIHYDFCQWNFVDNRYDFFKDEQVVAWVKSEKYRIYKKPENNLSGKECLIVSIRFSPSGRSYDYLCDDPSVKTGDMVVVEGYEGETEVEVTNISLKQESELPLPINRYKKIIRKG